MEIITGYVGKPHVTSEQDRDVHIGMIGSGSYVLQTGKQMTAEISSNNEIKVRDGVLMHQGCAASIKKNTYDSLSIVNGSQGMKRIDLIVARYERNENTGVESLTLKVLKGTPASANPATPAYTTGDIQAGDYIADMPMYKVTLDGINITKLEKMFQTVETNAALTQKVNELNSTLNSNTVINRSFPNYEKCKIVTTSTKKGIKFEQFGYLLVSSWKSDEKRPNVELWINSVKIYQSFSDYNNGLFYPISPSTWADFYVNAGSAQLYFIPCYA